MCTSSVSGATSITYVYDADGNLAAEYGTAPNASPAPCSTCYLSVDQLGSTRMVTDSGGNLISRYDYLPSGEELFVSTGVNRTAAEGYQSAGTSGFGDGFNPKFTGQVRDTENFLDYFNARYYSPQQGRFVSVDPENAGADPTSSVSWNGYSYVGNSPLSITDPSGESWFSILAGIFAGIFSGDPGVGFEVYAAFTGVEELGNGQPPWAWLGDPLPEASFFTGCGGPLGNCGGLGTNPWSEQSPLGAGVQDPNQFILNATPNFDTIWDNYPTDDVYPTSSNLPSNIWQLIGGKVEYNGMHRIFVNSCPFRLCYALNRSGLKVTYQNGKTSSGADGNWYYPRILDTIPFLTRNLGAPISLSKDTWQRDAAGRKGILYLDIPFSDATGHLTLWNGKTTIDARGHNYWTRPTFRGAKLWPIE